MPTARRSNRNRKTTENDTPVADTVEAVEEAADASLDAALDRSSELAARESLHWAIGATSALLRNLQAVHEAQLEATRRAQEAHEQAAGELPSAHGLADFTRIQLALAQSDGQAALQCLSRLGEVATRQVADTLNESLVGWQRLHEAAWSTAMQWQKLQARVPQSPEVLEAEVEHVTSPIAASPFVWPAQEAARQAATLAGSTWNDWLSWQGRLADAWSPRSGL